MPPLGWVSILHRLSGCPLLFLAVPPGVGLLAQSLSEEAGFWALIELIRTISPPGCWLWRCSDIRIPSFCGHATPCAGCAPGALACVLRSGFSGNRCAAAIHAHFRGLAAGMRRGAGTTWGPAPGWPGAHSRGAGLLPAIFAGAVFTARSRLRRLARAVPHRSGCVSHTADGGCTDPACLDRPARHSHGLRKTGCAAPVLYFAVIAPYWQATPPHGCWWWRSGGWDERAPFRRLIVGGGWHAGLRAALQLARSITR